mmetsp:Transcript_5449/g.7082  ORF Transcript_5449/g.7082 Transcript_5449/m.7082 type:complete len:314 (+) Transcript_5449:92-1033(+)
MIVMSQEIIESQSLASVATIEYMISPHLKTRALNLEQACEYSLEAEKIASAASEEALKLSFSRGSGIDTIKRIPNCRVRLFEGIYFRGTYIGLVDGDFQPHGLGTFHETKGFAISRGAFGAHNRGSHGIKYQGSWSHGEIDGYGKLEQNQDIQVTHSGEESVNKLIKSKSITVYFGRFVNGLKDGYGVSRYLRTNDMFYQGEYLSGYKSGYGVRRLINGKASHNITYSNENFSKEGGQIESVDENKKIMNDAEDSLISEISELAIKTEQEASSPQSFGSKQVAASQRGAGGLWTQGFPVNKAALSSTSPPQSR